jgi:hypothetical protein
MSVTPRHTVTQRYGCSQLSMPIDCRLGGGRGALGRQDLPGLGRGSLPREPARQKVPLGRPTIVGLLTINESAHAPLSFSPVYPHPTGGSHAPFV